MDLKSPLVMKLYCESVRRASAQPPLDVSNKTQNVPVIIYSKHKALYSIMVMISCAASFIVSTSKSIKRRPLHNLFGL